MKIDKKVRDNLLENFQNSLSISLLISITLFLFAPIDMFFSNQTEFWFSFSDIIVMFMITTVSSTVILSIFLVLLLSSVKKGQHIILSLAFSFGIGLYIQGNFLVLDYGVLDGSSIDWSSYTLHSIVNLIFWLVIFISPLFLYCYKKKWFNIAVRCIPLYVIAIQCITLVTLVVTNDISKEETVFLTSKYQFDLSKDENTIIFVVDTLDIQYTHEMIEEFPEVLEIFKDFTFFDNCLGAYPNTTGGLPFIITGNPYLYDRSYQDYLSDAYFSSDILSSVEEQYDFSLYTVSKYVPISPVIDIKNAELSYLSINNSPSFLQEYFDLILFRYSPTFLKSYFWIDNQDFSKFIMSTDKKSSYTTENLKFYNELKDISINIESSRPQFKLYHLDGTHAPLDMNEFLQPSDSTSTSYAKEAKGCFLLIEEYIEQMKRLDIYENANIVIMADHGGEGLRGSSSLLIKQSNTSHNVMQINSAPISYLEDWNSTIIALVKNEMPEIFSRLITDGRMRYYYFNSFDKAWTPDYTAGLNQYVSYNELSELTTMISESINVSTTQELNGTFNSSCIGMLGWHGFEDNGVWTNRESKINFNTDLNTTFILEVTYNKFQSSKETIIYFNDIEVSTLTKVSDTATILLSKEHFKKDTQQSIRIYTPEAASPNELGTGGDVRTLGIMVSSITLSPIENVTKQVSSYLKVDGEKPYSITLSDWHDFEANATWTSSDSSVQFQTELETDFTITFPYHKFQSDKETIVYFNDVEVEVLSESAGTASVLLPKDLLLADEMQTIRFVTPEATSPKELGRSEDGRILGIMVESITIAPHDENP